MSELMDKAEDVLTKIEHNNLREISLEDALILIEASFEDGWDRSKLECLDKVYRDRADEIEGYKDEYLNSSLEELSRIIIGNNMKDEKIKQD